MKWKLSLPKAPMMLYYFVKFIGLAPFTVKNNGFYPPTLLGKLYSVAVTAAYLILQVAVFTYMLRKSDSFNISQLTIIGASIRHFIAAQTTFFTLMIFLFMYKEILYIMNKLCDVGNELKSLGIENNLEKMFTDIFRTTVVANVILSAACITLSFLDSLMPFAYSLNYTINNLFNLNAWLIFGYVLSFIGQRIKLLNERLYDMFRPAAGHLSSHHQLHMFVVCENPGEQTRPGIEEVTDLQCVQTIEILHMELCDLVDRTTQLFAVPILLNSLRSCIELMQHCFWIYHLAQNPSGSENTSITINVLVSLIRIAIVIVQLLAVAYVSEKVCREGNAMEVALFRVWHQSMPQKLEDEFFLFCLQLKQKSVTVSVLGFLALDCTYVYKIFCTVLAYVIIMIQFDALEPDSSY